MPVAVTKSPSRPRHQAVAAGFVKSMWSGLPGASHPFATASKALSAGSLESPHAHGASNTIVRVPRAASAAIIWGAFGKRAGSNAKRTKPPLEHAPFGPGVHGRSKLYQPGAGNPSASYIVTSSTR